MTADTDHEGGPVALVTGASSGIGKGIVEALVAHGFRVGAVSRSGGAGFAGTPSVRSYACDVRDPVAVQATIEEVAEDFGRLDGLVNCAGALVEAPLEEVTDEQIRLQFEVNVFGTLYTCRSAAPFLGVNGGSIVNVSSLLTRRTWPGTAVYTGTKGAVEALSRTLAHELAESGIRVNVVSPSMVRSGIYIAAGMSPDAYDDLLDEWQERFPLGRVGEPADVAGIVAFLLSPMSSWITGTNIPVDGGRGVA
ncbi:MAG: family oxidoreductase [Blastococcus sp.]|nr:family oxidoreductase [Blastococcus sp.]